MPRLKTAIVFFVLLLLLAIFIPGYSRLQRLKGINTDLTGQIKKLTIKNAQLAEEVKKLKQDPLYIEKAARKQTGMSKKGEVIYRITGDEQVNE